MILPWCCYSVPLSLIYMLRMTSTFGRWAFVVALPCTLIHSREQYCRELVFNATTLDSENLWLKKINKRPSKEVEMENKLFMVMGRGCYDSHQVDMKSLQKSRTPHKK